MALTKVTSGLISADASSVDLNIDAGTLYIDSTNNNVGINNASPQTKIHVVKSAVTGFIARTGSTATFENSSGVELYLSSSDSGYGQIRFGDTASTYSGGIQYEHSTDEMLFQCNGSEAMRISGGNVGIGTSSPSVPLSVESSSTTLASFYQSTNAAEFVIKGAATNVLTLAGGTGDSLAFETAGSERMRIDSSGNLGIGTSSIDYQATNRTVVHVEGSAGALLALEDTGAKSYFFQSGNDLLIENDTSTGSIIFGTNASTERMRIGTSSQQGLELANSTADNKNVRIVIVQGDGGSNTVQVYWGVAFGTQSGCLGAWDRSGNFASPATTITSSNQWAIYGFIYEGA